MKSNYPSSLSALIAAVLLCAVLFVCGCSGTGTMYSPEDDDEASAGDTAYMGVPGQDAAQTEAGAPHDDAGSRGAASKGEGSAPQSAPEEEPRGKKAFLGGNGSDLYSAKTVDYYYGFTLEGVSLQLPCSAEALTGAGWDLVILQKDGEGGSNFLIPAYSYEFFDAVPAAAKKTQSGSGQASAGASGKKVRLCLANFQDTPKDPLACTVCGITAALDSGVSLQTVFGVGTGSTLADLTSVFGTDDSIFTLTRYSDGTSALCYRFSNGLMENEHIPVLQEAEEKLLAECLVADTATDGQTISKLSLYYFRIEDTAEDAAADGQAPGSAPDSESFGGDPYTGEASSNESYEDDGSFADDSLDEASSEESSSEEDFSENNSSEENSFEEGSSEDNSEDSYENGYFEGDTIGGDSVENSWEEAPENADQQVLIEE